MAPIPKLPGQYAPPSDEWAPPDERSGDDRMVIQPPEPNIDPKMREIDARKMPPGLEFLQRPENNVDTLRPLKHDIAYRGQPVGAPAKAAADLPGVKDLTGLPRRQFGQFAGGKPVGMIIHHTSANEKGAEQVARALRYRGLGVQYSIDRDGNISRLIPEGERGAHMREGKGPGAGLSNANMAGVEIIGDPAGGLPINEKQIEAAGRLIGWHSQTYGYDPQTRVFGHGEVNPHKERAEGMEVVSRLRAGTLDLGLTPPKPGSAQYWAQGRAPKSDTQVAQAIIPPAPRPATRPGQMPVPPAPVEAKRPAAQPQEVAGAPPFARQRHASARSNGRQRSISAAPQSRSGFSQVALQGDGYGLGVIATAYEVELPESGDVELSIPVPMTFI